MDIAGDAQHDVIVGLELMIYESAAALGHLFGRPDMDHGNTDDSINLDEDRKYSPSCQVRRFGHLFLYACLSKTPPMTPISFQPKQHH